MRSIIFRILSGILATLALGTGGLLLFCGRGWEKLGGAVVMMGYFLFFGAYALRKKPPREGSQGQTSNN